MVSDQEPRYQLLDSSGTVVGTFYQKADGTLAVQDGVSESEVVFDGDTLGSGSETVDVGSVNTGDLNINNETLLDVGKQSKQSYATANGWVTVEWDDLFDDVLGDFDLANNKFVPPESGYYDVKAQVVIDKVTDQDAVNIRLRNITDNFTVIETPHNTSGVSQQNIQFQREKELTAGKSYKIQINNFDNDMDIIAGVVKTYWSISRSEEK